MERPRSMRIVFATDGSEGAEKALDLLCCLPHRRKDDFVVVLSVTARAALGLDHDAFVNDGLVAESAATEIADGAARRLGQCGIAADSRVAEGPTARAIIDAAVAHRADLIVMGSRGRGLIAGALLGSTARARARHSPIPVLVVRERREAPRRVLVAIDGSPDSQAAIATLAAFPIARGTEVVLLHVLPQRAGHPDTGDAALMIEQDARQHAMRFVAAAAHALPCGVSTRVDIREGPVAERILNVATAIGADLIVLGSRGRELGSGFLQGSTADRVLAGAHCAVLVARAAEAVKTEDRGRRALVMAGAV